MHYTRISADCHIDLPWLPPDLFTANASLSMKDRMPYVADGPDGPYWTSKKGGSFGLVCGVGPAGQKFVPGMHHRVDIMASTGLYDDGKKSSKYIAEQFGHLPPDVTHKITCENAGKFYGLIA